MTTWASAGRAMGGPHKFYDHSDITFFSALAACGLLFGQP